MNELGKALEASRRAFDMAPGARIEDEKSIANIALDQSVKKTKVKSSSVLPTAFR